jgi:peptidoglycan/xylan/chitin deacetylase (PgdA/CDA1 family)
MEPAPGGGHELAAHGWAQNEYLHEQGPDGQARTIGRTLDALESAAGRRPGGWLTPVYGGDLHTPGLLARAGFAWHCDVLDASAPRREMHHGLPIVGIPWSEFVDNRVLRASPRDYFDAYRGSFDFQYRSEPLALLHIGIHAHFGGRPLVSAMFDEVLRHIRGHEGVWFPTCSELAGFVAAQPVGAFDFRARFFGGRT